MQNFESAIAPYFKKVVDEKNPHLFTYEKVYRTRRNAITFKQLRAEQHGKEKAFLDSGQQTEEVQS